MNLAQALKKMSGATAATVRGALGPGIGAAEGAVAAVEARAGWRFASGAGLAQVLDLTRLDEPAVRPRDARPATLAIRVKTRGFDETHAVDVAVFGGPGETHAGLTALVREGLEPGAPGVRAALAEALAAHVDPDGENDAAERAEALGALIRGLDARERAVDPPRARAGETRHVTTGADAGGVRLAGGGEGAALQLGNGAGDGGAGVTVGARGPRGTRPIEGVHIEVVSEDVRVCAHDCGWLPAMGLDAGLYAAHDGDDAGVWLEPVDTVPEGPFLELAPASGAWRARVAGRYARGQRRRWKEWTSALWVTLEGAQCERAPGALHLRTGEGAAWTIHHEGGVGERVHIDVERHRDGRIRMRRYGGGAP